MIFLDILNAKNEVVFSQKGFSVNAEYKGELSSGYKIKLVVDKLSYVAVKFDKTLKESYLYLQNKSFTYTIPTEKELKMAYSPNAFKGSVHNILAREVDKEFFTTRNVALNSHDLKNNTDAYPHASANFVTREEPCFYERNAIDGEINNQGHGNYPYQSWAGGARNDLEYTLDFGKPVEIDKIIFYLRADFKHDHLGIPHDSYWKEIDIEFSNGEVFKGQFKLDNSNLNEENSKGIEITFDKKVTKTIKLFNFKQVTEILGFAALTQIEVIGRYIKEDLSKMEVRQASNAKDAKYYDTERLRQEFHISNLFTKDNVRMVYSHFDRIITAGIMPVCKELKLEAGKELASEYFLERREMGCINVGGKGVITIDGVDYDMNPRDGIYIGKGNKEITFRSVDETSPAKFYVSSCPAHTTYPIVKIDISKAKKFLAVRQKSATGV